MTPRELTDAAAKAIGITLMWPRDEADLPPRRADNWLYWNPLHNDGDAFQLMTALRLDMSFEKLHTVAVWCGPMADWSTEYCADGMGADINEKTRLAIVRSAAELGKGMA